MLNIANWKTWKSSGSQRESFRVLVDVVSTANGAKSRVASRTPENRNHAARSGVLDKPMTTDPKDVMF